MKKILISILAVVGALVIAFVACYFSIPNFNGWVNGKISSGITGGTDDNGSDDKNDTENKDGDIVDIGGTEIENGESNGVALYSAKMPRSAYRANGVSTQADSAFRLTAVVEPADVPDKSVDWSVAWKDENSSFASGKTVTDYVTVTPTSDGALTANAVCNEAFGEQIIITVTPRKSLGEVSASCTVNYVQRLLGVGFKASCNDPLISYGFTLSTSNLNPVIDFPVYTDGMDWQYGLTQTNYCSILASAELSTVYTKSIGISDGYYFGFKISATTDYLNALRAGGCSVNASADTYKMNGSDLFASLFFTNWGTFVSNWSGLLSSLRNNSSKVMLRIKCMSNVYDDNSPSWVYNIKFNPESVAALATNITLSDTSIDF